VRRLHLHEINRADPNVHQFDIDQRPRECKKKRKRHVWHRRGADEMREKRFGFEREFLALDSSTIKSIIRAAGNFTRLRLTHLQHKSKANIRESI